VARCRECPWHTFSSSASTGRQGCAASRGHGPAGLASVIYAFHVSRGGQPTQTRFFVDERTSRQASR